MINENNSRVCREQLNKPRLPGRRHLQRRASKAVAGLPFLCRKHASGKQQTEGKREIETCGAENHSWTGMEIALMRAGPNHPIPCTPYRPDVPPSKSHLLTLFF